MELQCRWGAGPDIETRAVRVRGQLSGASKDVLGSFPMKPANYPGVLSPGVVGVPDQCRRSFSVSSKGRGMT